MSYIDIFTILKKNYEEIWKQLKCSFKLSTFFQAISSHDTQLSPDQSKTMKAISKECVNEEITSNKLGQLIWKKCKANSMSPIDFVSTRKNQQGIPFVKMRDTEYKQHCIVFSLK
jgi:hypothetical protein